MEKEGFIKADLEDFLNDDFKINDKKYVAPFDMCNGKIKKGDVLKNKLKDENTMCIALGHDLMEDIDGITYEYLVSEFNITIADGIKLLTLDKLESRTYEQYVTDLISSGNREVIKIKLADLEHNSQITRLKGLRDKDFQRLEKYHRAYSYITEKLK